MLAKRVILCLTFSDGVLMRTKRFVPDYRYTQAYSCAGDADQVILLDVTKSGPYPAFGQIVQNYCRRLDIPIVVGGHVRSVDYALELMNCGAFGVVVGWGGKDVYEKIAYRVGSQALTAGIDVSASGIRGADQAETVSGISAQAEQRGAGEILLTSISRDGSLSGYDVSALREVVEIVRVPVIIAGGCGGWSHMAQAFEAGAQGAATSCIMHLNPTAMRSCKQWLTQNYSGPIRPSGAGHELA